MANSNWNTENILDQKGKVIIVTGATSGLGKEATRILAGKNATVIMAVRNVRKAERVKNDVIKQYPTAIVKILELDLGSLSSIKQFSDEMINQYDRLDVLINNAGVMMCPFSTTEDGFEIQMGTNHLGPFALTGQLMPLLKKTKDSRVVSTSSLAHTQGDIDFSNINWENKKYNTSKAYGDSKLANLYFTYEMAKRFKGVSDAPMVTAAHPGWTKTDLQKHSLLFRLLNPIFSQGVEQGVLPTLRAAFDAEAVSGDYYGPAKFFEMQGHPVKVTSNKKSYQENSAQQLWEQSEKLTGVNYF